MKKIILVPNCIKDSELNLTKQVVKKLVSLGITPYVENNYSSLCALGAVLYDDIPDDGELIIVIGGDGSVIDASLIAVENDLPLLGINLGKVGYLATVDPQDIDKLDNLISGDYLINEKMLLYSKKFSSDGSEILCNRLAVNDVVICRGNNFGISDFRVENSFGDQVCYRADGVVISTPTGSTAYSLSAGGPVISHTLDSIVVTPICPHSFFNRAIVYGADEEIKVTNLGELALNVSIDGRLFCSLEKEECCVVYKENKKIKTMTFGESNLFTCLSKKIKLLHDTV